jgi:hypothetical protein
MKYEKENESTKNFRVCGNLNLSLCDVYPYS